MKYKHGRKLVGDRTAQSRLNEIKVTESQCADDTALYSMSRDAFESTTQKFINAATHWGLTVSIHKTKGMSIDSHPVPEDTQPVLTEEGLIEMVNNFTYLGSNVRVDGEIRDEVKCRIAKAAKVFGCLQRSIFQNRRLSTETKRKVYRATVLSVLLYGAETWTTKAENLQRLNAFHHKFV